MVAILEDAVASSQEYCAAKHGKRKQLFNDVEKWFFATSTGWVFDFESICSSVGFDPDYFRRRAGALEGKRVIKKSQRSLWKRKEKARAQLFRGISRVMTDLFENEPR